MHYPPPSATNKLLGYPSDARLLIINADDFGMCQSTSAAIFRSLTEGIVCSTTLMVPCAWSPYAMQLLTEHPTIPFGIHLTAIGDSARYRWRPLSCRDEVSSLVDETGHFYSSERSPEFLAKAKLVELEVEFRAQIETVLAANLKPTHLDWHSIRIAKRPELFDLMFKLAKEYGFALRVRERSLIEKVQRQDLPTNDYDFLDSYELETTGKSARYAKLLRDLPAGLSEWAVHPGLENAELLAIEPAGAAVRQADLDFLVSAQAREIIRQEGITLLSYQPLQEVWLASSTNMR
ncbi:MAG: polysaccharide deacetylase family protein [Anaerolineae bacterium]|nr:polysaccharide deacetylase family protein [Anaerolineae bacterium]